jgi:hypothetical protein
MAGSCLESLGGWTKAIVAANAGRAPPRTGRGPVIRSLIFLHHPPSLYYGFIYFQRR